MDMTNGKPLTSLTHGNILIVGAKASNFSEEIKNNPRVILWDSQNEHWLGKGLPDNVRVIFITRWIGHNAFKVIQTEARKRQLTIFNPEGTGIIAKQVKELLNMTPKEVVYDSMTTLPVVKPKTTYQFGKLKALLPFIDFTKTNVGNAHVLLEKAKEFGFTTTLDSLSQFVGVERKKQGIAPVVRRGPGRPHKEVTDTPKELDVTVQILDHMIGELKDMRDFLIDTVKENRKLRAKMDKFRNWFKE